MASVLIADDHALIRNGLKQLLAAERIVDKIGESASGRETLDRLQTDHWDLLILDINMPDRSGIDILKYVRATHADTRVLILSGFPERQYAINVLRAGASGYLNKEMAPEELMTAVRTVLQGRRYVTPTLAEQLVSELDVEHDKLPHSTLSEREFQIFCKLATGRQATAIAAELCISVKTVSTYRSRILQKMGFNSNADMTAYALRNNMIQ
jgi:two-component system invasion response regulator UvrY